MAMLDEGYTVAIMSQSNPPQVARLFGTDGIRGRANVHPISPESVLQLGQAVGLYFKSHYDKPRILIGKDTRKSGYMLEQALSSGICSVGVDTCFLGPLPTPGIAYLTRGMRASAGIVISASHNPYDDNGIKVFAADGYKLPDAAENELEALFTDPGLKAHLPTGKAIGTTQRIDDAVGQYAVFLKEQFPKHLSLDGLRVVLDCANGAAYRVAPKVFEELGAEVFVVAAAPDGTNINADCGAVYPRRLVTEVNLYKADIGIGLDGDADRVVVVDEHGEIVDGDQILAICGLHYLQQQRLQAKTLVATVMSNMGLDRAMERHGGQVVRTQVGDRYVVEVMRQHHYNLGGEQSGHIIFRDSSTTGDGILAALSLIEIILEKGESLHSLKGCMQRLPQVLRSIRVQQKVPLSQLPELDSLVNRIQEDLGKQGRVLFRYSGTENKARIMIEGEDRERIETMAAEVAEKACHLINQSQV